MDDLKLPALPLTQHKHKTPPPDVICEWRSENVRLLKESGQMKRIRAQASRQPSAVRFTL
jgi:hypothetical protein